MFSFELKGDRSAFVDSLELFGIGYSWGGYESLALPVDPYRSLGEPPAPNLVRLHIGLEVADDLIARSRFIAETHFGVTGMVAEEGLEPPTRGL